MFRNSKGKLSFSFGRLITNAEPNFANDARADADLTPAQQDALFEYQVSQPSPKKLVAQSFIVAQVVDSTALAESIIKSLESTSILSPHPSDPTITTSRITKNFSNQLSRIPIHVQRRVVSVLFFWEEELMRWGALENEETDLKKTMQASGQETELSLMLQAVTTKWGLKPSARGGVDARGRELQEGLPVYTDGGVGASAGAEAGDRKA